MYDLIEKCEETVKIPWRYVLKDHERESMKFVSGGN